MKQRNGILILISVLIALSLACSFGGRTTPEPTTPVPDVPKTEETKEPDPVEPTATETPPTQPTATSVPKNKTTVVEIINNSGQDIVFLYIAPADTDNWGEDWLKGDVIAKGETYQITGIPDGQYDMEARDIDNIVIQTLWDVDVKGTFAWIVELEVSLEIYNSSEDTITEVYIALSDDESWGQDWLAGDVIPVDDYYYFFGMDVGLYDIKTVNADGDVVEIVYSFPIEGPYYLDIIGKADLPTNAVLRFEDDFTNNRNSWGDSENDTVRYNAPTNGEFCIDIKTNDLTAWEWYEPFRPDEFVAEVACYLASGTDTTCGLGFGPDGDNLYWFEISPEYQNFALFLLLNDEWQDSLIPWTNSYNINPYGWNYLSLERVSGVVSVYINGIKVGEVISDHFPTGRIGLGGSTYDDANVTVCLDDLRVWRME